MPCQIGPTVVKRHNIAYLECDVRLIIAQAEKFVFEIYLSFIKPCHCVEGPAKSGAMASVLIISILL